MFAKVAKYIADVRQETGKVVWPTRMELRESAVIVIILTLILAVFVFGIDFILNNILRLIL